MHDKDVDWQYEKYRRNKIESNPFYFIDDILW